MWEVAVSFTAEDEAAMASKGFAWEQSELGYVYYPKGQVVFEENAEILYTVYPWITKFDVKGIKIIKKVIE